MTRSATRRGMTSAEPRIRIGTFETGVTHRAGELHWLAALRDVAGDPLADALAVPEHGLRQPDGGAKVQLRSIDEHDRRTVRIDTRGDERGRSGERRRVMRALKLVTNRSLGETRGTRAVGHGELPAVVDRACQQARRGVGASNFNGIKWHVAADRAQEGRRTGVWLDRRDDGVRSLVGPAAGGDGRTHRGVARERRAQPLGSDER